MSIDKKVIKIKSIQRETWAGMVRYDKCKEAITPYLSMKGGVETGLDKETQERLEKELRLNPGELGRSSKFWDDFVIFLDTKDKYIYTDTPEGELQYHVIKVNPKIANSVAEMNEWPYAEYVICDDEEEAAQENSGIQIEIKALSKFDSLSPEEKRGVLKLYGKRSSNSSDDLVYNTLIKLIKKDPQDFLEKIKDKHLKTRILIEDLLSINSLKKNGTHYIFGDDVIGYDTESAIIFLEDPKNQSILISLKKKLESVKK